MPPEPSVAPGTAGTPDDVVVDGTTRECAGVIAALEKTMRSLPDGARVRALIADVPSRIDVHAWAGRKGHAIPFDRVTGAHFELTIVKGGASSRLGRP